VPIYEYRCSKCGEVFEALQKISDEPLSKCKFCGGKVERLISQSSFQLRGSGWYLTDYARKGASSEKSSDNANKSTEKSDKSSSTPAASSKTEKSPT
jgi:putative FmdB family regulatory protein